MFASATDFDGSTYCRYLYNERGELTQAANYLGEDANSTASPQLPGRRFGYEYDSFGNRKTATRALGTSDLNEYKTYANNQYAKPDPRGQAEYC